MNLLNIKHFDDVNVLQENINTIKRNTGDIIIAGKDGGEIYLREI
jgi:hypothetical protein